MLTPTRTTRPAGDTDGSVDSGGFSARLESLRAGRSAEVYRLLGSRPGGLTATEAAGRLAHSGANVLVEVAGRRLAVRLAANFTHLMAVLLWAGGALAFVAGLPQLGVAIWVVVVVNGVFSFWQEYRAEQATEALRLLLPSYARVLRDGREQQIPAEALVPGDVMLLAEGDRVSADARLVEDHELRVDQSTLTGESAPVRRTSIPVSARSQSPAECANLVLAGTAVTSGRGKAVVFATGMRREFGRIASLTQATVQEISPLQRELARLSQVVALMAVTVGAAAFAVAQLLTPMETSRGLVFSLGMIVALVPEGLLPTVTLSLAMATQRMARRQALVKRLSAVEALGCTTVICTDKTGTLTQNEMTVRELWMLSGRYEFTGAGYRPEGEVRRGATVLEVPVSGTLAGLLVAAGLANDARLLAPDADSDGWRVLGDPTEGALLVAAAKAGVDLAAEAARAPRILDLPFDSVRKRMTTVHTGGGGAVVYTKGAPRELLRRCAWIRTDDGDVALTEEHHRQVIAANDAYSRDALRVLAVAERRLPGGLPSRDPDELERDLVFLGLCTMTDPPRPEVAAAVETCRRAGIRILMMTGDYGLTAESVARRIGLVGSDGVRILNGEAIDALNDEELRRALDGEVILARTTPAHKLRVVAVLQASGHVVAVTGDGVNDAPALKKADIGIAMGRSGTDVAREAADMVLLDDNFASIVHAVEEGRAVYANIRKFTGYIFTSNTPEAVPFILFGLSGGRIPLALDVMHILAVDLGTDLAPALALGAEPPEPGVMDHPPRPRHEHLVTRRLLVRSYLWLGPLQALAVMAAFYAAYWTAGFEGRWLDLPDSGPLYAQATAMALAAVVTTQIGNLFAHRTEAQSVFRIGLGANRLVWVGIATEIAVILAVVYLAPLQRVVGTGAFPANQWLLLGAFIPLLLVADEARKAVDRHRRRGPARISSPGEAACLDKEEPWGSS